MTVSRSKLSRPPTESEKLSAGDIVRVTVLTLIAAALAVGIVAALGALFVPAARITGVAP